MSLIDVMHLGRDRVIGAYEIDGLIVDPGPSSCMDTLVAGLEEEPRALLLTHIHLDHAGASGSLVRRFPGLRVYVHESGAQHLVDPAKLLESATRLYGDDMDRLWGDVLPVPAESVVALVGGESIEGFRVAHAPGHARHHVVYLHEATGDAYVGDVAGVRIPPIDFTIPPTPPPDIDLEAWERSLDAVAEWDPSGSAWGGWPSSRATATARYSCGAWRPRSTRSRTRTWPCGTGRRSRPSSSGWASSAIGESSPRPGPERAGARTQPVGVRSHRPPPQWLPCTDPGWDLERA